MTNVLKKLPIKHILILGLAIAMIIGSTKYLKEWVANNQETVSLPVPAHVIYAGQVITPGDLTIRKFLKAAQEPLSVQNTTEINGMVAASDLYPMEQIRVDKLVASQNVLNTGEAYVSIKADSLEQVLGGQIRPNMQVDVYHVVNLENAPTLLAKDAVISGVVGASGKVTPVENDPPVPKWVILKVKESDSSNFTRPIMGGKVFLSQTGYMSMSTNLNLPTSQTPPQSPQEQVQLQEPVKSTQRTRPASQQPATQTLAPVEKPDLETTTQVEGGEVN